MDFINEKQSPAHNEVAELEVLTQSELEPISEVEVEEEKPIPSIISAKELMAIKTSPERYLLDPFLPVTGTALIAGQPDTGKSQFARQLAIQISQGADDFLGFKLKLKHKRAIYLATEDDAVNCQFLIGKQHEKLGYEPNKNLTFIFPESLDSPKLLREVDQLLTASPADLFVVDGFGDMFDGSDLNSNSQMRESVNKFDALAKKHKCLCFFVHHINKGAYNKKATQQGIQGGSGLTQKVRLAWVLSPQEGSNTKHLTVVKGNYCPREYKEKPIVLTFDEENFIFTRSNSQYVKPQVQVPELTINEKKIQKFRPELEKATNDGNGLRHKDLVILIEKGTGMSPASAKREISELKMDGTIKQDDKGQYHWGIQTSETESDEIGDDEVKTVEEVDDENHSEPDEEVEVE